MADELRGVGGLNHLALPPVRPSGPDDPLAMIAPAEPAPPSSTPAGPSATATTAQTVFGRSGIDVEQVLAAQDTIEARPGTERGELEQGLQQARAALVRRQPAETLRALNDVWPRAQFSEEAWYLRAGALTAMGMPIEADDVAAEALDQRPASLALRYAQSLARTVHGDLPGARSVLGPALDRAPDVPVLRAHLAQLLARQGRVSDAENELRMLARYFPGHPAVTWAEGLVRRERTAKLREGSVLAEEPPSPAGSPVKVGGSAVAPDAIEAAPEAAPEAATEAVPTTDETDRFGDPIRVAFRRLGMLIADPDALALGETRLLQRAFAGGGTMATVGPPEQQHAARSILASVATFLLGEPAEAQPISPRMDPLLAAIRSGRTAEARTLLQRDGDRFTPMQRKLLDALIEGTAPAVEPPSAAPSAPPSAAPPADHLSPAETARPEAPPVDVSTPAVPPEEEQVFLPIRLGLSLLQETANARAADYAAAQALPPGERFLALPQAADLPVGDAEWRDVLPPPPDAGMAGTGGGWGSAAAVVREQPVVLVPPSPIPLSVVVLTALVVMTGLAFGPGPAILVAVAIWFARGQRPAPPG